MEEPRRPKEAQLRDQLLGEVMLLEALLDDRQHLLVDQAGDRVLHHALFFAQGAADIEEIQRVECRKVGHVRSPGRGAHDKPARQPRTSISSCAVGIPMNS